MYEELFIIDNGKRLKVDLATPSGITLSFQSCIFGDVSKITCSHTYTFKLPLTANNRRVFGNADDIRANSGKVRRRLKAEFVQNGIPLFRNANLYITSTTTSAYNAVLTWDVVDGMQDLKDNDKELNKLPNDNTRASWGSCADAPATELFDNTAKVLYPVYNCGVERYRFNYEYYYSGQGRKYESPFTNYAAYAMPVVPVRKLLSYINSYYGTKFNLGEDVTAGGFVNGAYSGFDIINRGVIPLVRTDLNVTQLGRVGLTFNSPQFNNLDTTSLEKSIPCLLTFGSVAKTVDADDFVQFGRATLWKDQYSVVGNYDNAGIIPQKDMLKFELDGCISCTFENSGEDEPTLMLYQLRVTRAQSSGGGRHPGAVHTRRQVREWVEVGSIEGERDGSRNGRALFYFDFAMANGKSRMELGTLCTEPIIFVLNYKVATLSVENQIKLSMKNSSDCRRSRPIDIISNLPDISCLTFIKGLFYMIGAFPKVDANGNVVPTFYIDIRNNLLAGRSVDWSSRLKNDATILPDECKYEISGMAQRNFYMMKSDSDEEDEEQSDEDKSTDVYKEGKLVITLNNETLDLSKTIIQLPYFAPYIQNLKQPEYPTGDTMKAWTLEGEAQEWERDEAYNRLKWTEPKPCFGLIIDHERSKKNTYDNTTTVLSNVMSMEVFDFSKIEANDSFAYMQRIMANPYIITEKMLLNEFDLRDLDYAMPVYLSKYNAYFAIVKITRDSKGICKCELLKLPEESQYGND